MLPRTCLASSPLSATAIWARHLLLGIILSEHDAASYCLRKFFLLAPRSRLRSIVRIAFGFIAYVGIKLLAGRLRDISVAVAVLAALFVVKFALL